MRLNPIALIINIAIPLAFGVAGAFFTSSSVTTWYVTLAKPSFNPPNQIFAPVWTALYILIGISAYRVWQKRDTINRFPRTIAIYFIQLMLNLMWSFIFFYSNQIGVAVFEIVFLLFIAIVNAILFYRIDKIAGLLFIPYILWIIFATVLTYNIFILN
ncbi:tryptophan-rich sensory protein [Pedobacter hiemivivus]|uniref:Tryptophan-rich sensory protein n=1 Tax=Pedobacter hiemivivus TaxID=2530454 RepID=A0A4U1FZB5_9SPHI|nr:TspO/MBR family protein [Pedobacter hiemivivus]TCC96582.1 tryptophan-rich sensory protein [Pedobacter hiemivivus]TKC56495.1 tryptophan-rich sensory protein [Pedobacter hiemivivus]